MGLEEISGMSENTTAIQTKRLIRVLLVFGLILVGVVFSIYLSYVLFPADEGVAIRVCKIIVTACILAVGALLLFLLSWGITGPYSYVMFGQGYTIVGLAKELKKRKQRALRLKAVAHEELKHIILTERKQ